MINDMLDRLAGVVSDSYSTTKNISTLVAARLSYKFVGAFFLLTVALFVHSVSPTINLNKNFVDGALQNIPHLSAKIGPLHTQETIIEESIKKSEPTSLQKTLGNISLNFAAIETKPSVIKTPKGSLKYQSKLRVFATSYDSTCPGCSGTTALGLKAGYGVIAVDPKIIPLGTKVYVQGYGEAVAGDTGGSIKGNVVDLGFDSIETGWWSSRYTNLYILSK